MMIVLIAYEVPVIAYQKHMGTDDAYHSYPHWHELHLDIFEQRWWKALTKPVWSLKKKI